MLEPNVPKGTAVNTLKHIPTGMNSLNDCGQLSPTDHIITAFKNGVKYHVSHIAPSQIGEEPNPIKRYSHILSSIDTQPTLTILGLVVGISQSVKGVVD